MSKIRGTPMVHLIIIFKLVMKGDYLIKVKVIVTFNIFNHNS